MNSPVTLEWWTLRFHECPFLFNYTKKEIQESVSKHRTHVQQHKHPLNCSLQPDNFHNNIRFSQKLRAAPDCLSLLMTTELLMSQQKVKNGQWANVNLKCISLFPELRHAL